jgi:hypothetical protein
VVRGAIARVSPSFMPYLSSLRTLRTHRGDTHLASCAQCIVSRQQTRHKG